MNLLHAAAVAVCTSVFGIAARAAVAQPQRDFTEEESARLAAGELVTRPLHTRRGSLDLIGGSSWQVIDAAPEVVWDALHDVARYPQMLPGVKQSRVVAGQGRERHVYVRQGAWPVFTTYYAVLRSDPAARVLEFELDRERPHKVNAGWGFARVVAYRGSKTLLAFGMLADVGRGLLVAVGRAFLRKWMLKLPSTVKHYLEHGGRELYRRAAEVSPRPSIGSGPDARRLARSDTAHTLRQAGCPRSKYGARATLMWSANAPSRIASRHPAAMSSAIGAALGLGAPAGFFILRRFFVRAPSSSARARDRRAQTATYWYMALATPIVFGAFGWVLGRQQERLRLSHAQIERLREEFAAVVAHDLRTPIQAILLHIHALLQDASDGSVTVPVETLLQMRRGSQRLAHMINDLLDATRIEAARLRLNPQPVSLPESVAALVDRLRPALGAHAIELSLPAGCSAILVDPARLDQIITNVLENAAKYSADGAPIRVSVQSDAGGAAVSVEDQGIGIAPEELPLLFNRFYQSKRARAKKTGLGLGLYITKGLVEASGGRITVRSQVDRGSTFSIWLPSGSGHAPDQRAVLRAPTK